ncbi:MAG TPA: DOMON-like domain-containing protein [Phenylobacterium sp.]|jgi:hypothetical protein
MRHVLKAHPDFPAPAVSSIVVDAARDGDRLTLSYRLEGRSRALRLPPVGPPKRGHELWRHTCFEAFVLGLPGEAYTELNLAPSTQWAAYGFDGYRRGMAALEGFAAPRIETRQTAKGVELDASADLSGAAELAGHSWRLGLSAVIEAADGSFSYWALAHPPGRPDFHAADCFALDLPAPEAP